MAWRPACALAVLVLVTWPSCVLAENDVDNVFELPNKDEEGRAFRSLHLYASGQVIPYRMVLQVSKRQTLYFRSKDFGDCLATCIRYKGHSLSFDWGIFGYCRISLEAIETRYLRAWSKYDTYWIQYTLYHTHVRTTPNASVSTTPWPHGGH